MSQFLNGASLFKLNNNQTGVETLRKEFVSLYDRNRLTRLTLYEYAIGQADHDNFCFWIERKLHGMGSILGATASKFGVYFDVKTHEPIWTKRTEGNFNVIRDDLVSLYDAGLEQNLASIKDNKLSSLFKGKILAVYFPERYLNIFAEHHLEYFLDKLGIAFESSADLVDLRELLIGFKNQHDIFSSWTAVQFGYYLYYCFGAPSQVEIDEEQEYFEQCYDIEQDIVVNRMLTNDEPAKRYADLPLPKPEYIETPFGYTYKRNEYKKLQAIADADYCCEVDPEHISFLRKDGKHMYTEAHHLIPMAYQDDYENSLDTTANIVSLCSNCHKWIHYGKGSDQLLKTLLGKRQERLRNAGLIISLHELQRLYQ